MSLRPIPVPPVPEETARVARAAFRKGCLAMRVRDEVGPLFCDEQFASAFPRRGGPALSPGAARAGLGAPVRRGAHRPAGRRRGACPD